MRSALIGERTDGEFFELSGQFDKAYLRNNMVHEVLYNQRHPFGTCFVSCGPSEAVKGPSPQDQAWAAKAPTAFAVVQSLDSTLYYGPRSGF